MEMEYESMYENMENVTSPKGDYAKLTVANVKVEAYQQPQSNVRYLKEKEESTNSKIGLMKQDLKCTKKIVVIGGLIVFIVVLAILAAITSHNQLSYHTLKDQINAYIVADKSNISNAHSRLNALENEQTNLTSLFYQTNELQSQINYLKSKLRYAEGNITSITNRMGSPVSLYNNCTKENAICCLDSNYYCQTNYLTIDLQNYTTIDIRCIIGQRLGNTTRATSLIRGTKKGVQSVRCQCSLVHVSEYNRLAYCDGLLISCMLIITRCPLSQTIFP